ncbi:MAG: beta-ketoacyl-ACP synthase [Cyanobacteria bacterium J06623_4]
MTAENDVVVTGLSLQTALGDSVQSNWQRLMAGESAIALRQPFLDLDPSPLAMAGKAPIRLTPMTATLAQAAWLDAGLPLSDDAGAGCGVVIGSSRSHLSDLEAMAFQHIQAPGFIEGDWFAALAHRPALTVARTVGATGPLLSPMAACATGIWAIAQAAALIRSGQCQRVIAGAVESPITPLTIAGFLKMGALAKTGCYPFDTKREGFVLGEGGAVMVLESAALANARGVKHIYAKVLGIGITNDAHHISSFDPSYTMGHRAVSLCLARSGWQSADVDAVHTHGTSTPQNDQMEARLIRTSLHDRVAVMATKGATGHTLGASGAINVGISLCSLRQQAVVPCTGLRQADFDLNFVRVGQSALLRKVVCLSFGFGGQNAALALSVAN